MGNERSFEMVLNIIDIGSFEFVNVAQHDSKGIIPVLFDDLVAECALL